MAIETDFSNRTVLITGAAGGIGLACAQWLAAQGVGKLVVVDRDEDALAALDPPCEMERIAGDVSDPALWGGIELGTIRHAVVNAGIAAGSPIVETSFADWRRILSVNLDGAFLALRSAMRAMADGGSIVLLSSVSGIKATPGAAAYATSKAALIQLARVAALEGAPTGIRVNAIAPGGVDTPIWDKDPGFAALSAEKGREQALAAMASGTPSGRFASPEEIAETIGFLLSDAASNMTGSVVSSDGGFAL